MTYIYYIHHSAFVASTYRLCGLRASPLLIGTSDHRNRPISRVPETRTTTVTYHRLPGARFRAGSAREIAGLALEPAQHESGDLLVFAAYRVASCDDRRRCPWSAGAVERGVTEAHSR